MSKANLHESQNPIINTHFTDIVAKERKIRELCNGDYPKDSIGELYQQNGVIEVKIREMLDKEMSDSEIVLSLTDKYVDHE
jgi:hypothetical protein